MTPLTARNKISTLLPVRKRTDGLRSSVGQSVGLVNQRSRVRLTAWASFFTFCRVRLTAWASVFTFCCVTLDTIDTHEGAAKWLSTRYAPSADEVRSLNLTVDEWHPRTGVLPCGGFHYPGGEDFSLALQAQHRPSAVRLAEDVG